MQRDEEFYLRDGLCASFDGYQICLRAPRELGSCCVYLEPAVLKTVPRLRRPTEVGCVMDWIMADAFHAWDADWRNDRGNDRGDRGRGLRNGGKGRRGRTQASVAAGIVLFDDVVVETAPIVRYMRNWSRDRVRAECNRRGWTVSVVWQMDREDITIGGEIANVERKSRDLAAIGSL